MSNDDDERFGSAGVVDFDALNAALGALPPPPAAHPLAESEGRSNATYASARPHAPARANAHGGEINAPSIIVSDDTVPTGAPHHMTAPMGAPHGHAPPMHAPGPHAMPAGMPHPMHPPGSEPRAYATAPYGSVPPPPSADATVQIPHRAPRLRAPTIVVRDRGPTKQQKLLVFMLMLLVFVGGGIAFILVYRPPGLNIDHLLPGIAPAPHRTAVVPLAPAASALPPPPAAPSVMPSAPSSVVTVPPAATLSAAASASAAASVRKPLRPLAPAPTH